MMSNRNPRACVYIVMEYDCHQHKFEDMGGVMMARTTKPMTVLLDLHKREKTIRIILRIASPKNYFKPTIKIINDLFLTSHTFSSPQQSPVASRPNVCISKHEVERYVRSFSLVLDKGINKFGNLLETSLSLKDQSMLCIMHTQVI